MTPRPATCWSWSLMEPTPPAPSTSVRIIIITISTVCLYTVFVWWKICCSDLSTHFSDREACGNRKHLLPHLTSITTESHSENVGVSGRSTHLHYFHTTTHCPVKGYSVVLFKWKCFSLLFSISIILIRLIFMGLKESLNHQIWYKNNILYTTFSTSISFYFTDTIKHLGAQNSTKYMYTPTLGSSDHWPTYQNTYLHVYNLVYLA